MAIFKNRKKYAVSTQEQEVKIKLTKMAKREMVLTMISIFAVLIVSMGSAYAVFTSFDSSKEYNQVSVGKLDITYQAEEGEGYSNKINLEGAFPELDETGMESVPYKFTLTNNGTLAASYTVSIKDDQELISQDGCGEKQLDKNQIKISINGGSPEILSSLLDVTGENYVIDQGDLSKGASRSYEVRMWIDNDAGNEVLGTHFHGMIVVDGKEFRSGDGSPILSDNLIPVVYDGSNWVTTKEEDPEWYNYEERKWANAITVREGVRESYKKSGKTVDVVNDVLQMWVWIPRYSYTIKNTYNAENPGEIDVKFIDTAQKDGGEATYSG